MVRLHSANDLEREIQRIGFLPFFRNDINHFSIEEFTPRNYWFSDEVDGPWEWKGIVSCNEACVYGKLFNGKAGFVSMDWLPDFLNYRRSRYPLFDDPNDTQRLIYDMLVEHESLLSKELKELCGLNKSRKKKFDLNRVY